MGGFGRHQIVPDLHPLPLREGLLIDNSDLDDGYDVQRGACQVFTRSTTFGATRKSAHARKSASGSCPRKARTAPIAGAWKARRTANRAESASVSRTRKAGRGALASAGKAGSTTAGKAGCAGSRGIRSFLGESQVPHYDEIFRLCQAKRDGQKQRGSQ